jgi:hypothetical protein
MISVLGHPLLLTYLKLSTENFKQKKVITLLLTLAQDMIFCKITTIDVLQTFANGLSFFEEINF